MGLWTFSPKSSLKKYTPSPLHIELMIDHDFIFGIFTPWPPKMTFDFGDNSRMARAIAFALLKLGMIKLIPM